MFSHSDILNRNVKFRLNCHCNSALCGSIQFCQDDTCQICYLTKLSCLLQCILSSRSIQNHQSFPICIRIFSFDDPVDLLQLFHQILLVVKSSCRINEQNVCFSCLGSTYCVEDNRCRICAFRSSDDLHSSTVGPFCQLLSCCCTERICCCQDHFSSLFLELSCQFTYRCSLTDSVDTDHQYHRGSVFKLICGLPYLHLLLDTVDQQLLALMWIFNMLFFYFLFQIINNGSGRIDTNISHYQCLFDLIIEIIVNVRETVKNSIHSGYNIVSRLCQAICQTSEKSFFLLSHKATSYLSRSFSIRFTDTRVDTPFSCIVIPYRRSAAFMVPLRCVITINCVSLVSL